MPTLRYAQRRLPIAEGQSVLDCLLAHGIQVPHSCRSGACQTGLMRAVDGLPPPNAQAGLRDTQKVRNHFLACICHPTDDLVVELPDNAEQAAAIPATVRGLELLNSDVMKIVLESHDPLDYRAGQFVTLVRDSQLSRSYSLASVPGEDEHLHLHVRRVPRGRASGWVHDELRPGHRVELRGPTGDCFYTEGSPQQGLLLIGTGSGLAPLFGIARDALRRGHTGPIRLFHGSRSRQGLYLKGDLERMVRQYSNFDYVPCISGHDVPKGHASGRADQVAMTDIGSLKGWRVFLCGHPDMVKSAKKRAFLAGASMKDIHADPFVINPPPLAAFN